MPIGPDTPLERRPDVITEAVLDDVVVLDPATSRYVRLNATAALLWGALGDSPETIDSLGRLLVARSSAPPERAMRDAAAFVEAMLSRGLIKSAVPS